MKFKANIDIMPLEALLDPQGKVVQNTLQNLGMKNLKSVRQGKYFEIEMGDSDQVNAEKKIDEMCKKLLANLIIEDYKINKS